jgi:hypothetical protein
VKRLLILLFSLVACTPAVSKLYPENLTVSVPGGFPATTEWRKYLDSYYLVGQSRVFYVVNFTSQTSPGDVLVTITRAIKFGRNEITGACQELTYRGVNNNSIIIDNHEWYINLSFDIFGMTIKDLVNGLSRPKDEYEFLQAARELCIDYKLENPYKVLSTQKSLFIPLNSTFDVASGGLTLSIDSGSAKIRYAFEPYGKRSY